MLEAYFRKYPDMPRAVQAQIQGLLREAGGSDTHVRMAIENEWPPAVFAEYLQTQRPHRSSLQRGPIQVVDTRIVGESEPEAEPSRPASRSPKPKDPGLFGRIGGLLGKIRKPKPEADPDQPSLKDKILPTLKWIGIVVGIAVIGFVAYSHFSQATPYSIAPPTNVQTQAPKPLTIRSTALVFNQVLNFRFPLLTLGLAGLFLLSLFESSARGDIILLDFFSTWITFALLVFRELIGHDWFLVGIGVFGIGGMFISTIWNPTEESQQKWWNRFDTTHYYVLGLALIFLKLMKSPALPYPDYLPIIVPILLVVIGMGKEMFRQISFSLFSLAVGVIPAFLQTGTALSLGLAVEVILAALGAQQGWVSARTTKTGFSVGGRKVEVLLAWDVVLFYIAEVVLIGFLLYGNYDVFVIQR